MQLTQDQVIQLINTHNHSGCSTSILLCLIWKESSFDTAAQNSTSSAKGLMQMTDPAVDTVNNVTPTGVHFEYIDMLDGAKSIECGTYYLDYLFNQQGGSIQQALAKYGGTQGYATQLLTCESCITNTPTASTPCLQAIHA